MKKIILLLTCCFPFSIWACSCIGEKTVKEEIIASDVVFLGKIIAKKDITINDDRDLSGISSQKMEYTVQVIKMYKGRAINNTLKIITGLGSGDCGNLFSIGSEYIIYSTYFDYFYQGKKMDTPYLHTNICTRTRRSEKKELKEIIRYLKN
jgi:excinuclease UvrABC nuclease subunit